MAIRFFNDGSSVDAPKSPPRGARRIKFNKLKQALRYASVLGAGISRQESYVNRGAKTNMSQRGGAVDSRMVLSCTSRVLPVESKAANDHPDLQLTVTMVEGVGKIASLSEPDGFSYDRLGSVLIQLWSENVVAVSGDFTASPSFEPDTLYDEINGQFPLSVARLRSKVMWEYIDANTNMIANTDVNAVGRYSNDRIQLIFFLEWVEFQGKDAYGFHDPAVLFTDPEYEYGDAKKDSVIKAFTADRRQLQGYPVLGLEVTLNRKPLRFLSMYAGCPEQSQSTLFEHYALRDASGAVDRVALEQFMRAGEAFTKELATCFAQFMRDNENDLLDLHDAFYDFGKGDSRFNFQTLLADGEHLFTALDDISCSLLSPEARVLTEQFLRMLQGPVKRFCKYSKMNPEFKEAMRKAFVLDSRGGRMRSPLVTKLINVLREGRPRLSNLVRLVAKEFSGTLNHGYRSDWFLGNNDVKSELLARVSEMKPGHGYNVACVTGAPFDLTTEKPVRSVPRDRHVVPRSATR